MQSGLWHSCAHSSTKEHSVQRTHKHTYECLLKMPCISLQKPCDLPVAMVTMHFFYSVTCINVEIALGVTNLPKVGLDCIIKKKQRGDSQHSY